MAELTYGLYKKRRAETGIPALNQVLLGGIPTGATVAVIGPPGVGKTIFGKQFLYQGVVMGEPTIVFSTSESLADILERMHQFGWNSDLNKKLIYGDCYSWKYRKEAKEYSASLKNPTEVGILLNKIIQGERIEPKQNPRIVIDSFSDFVLAAGEERAISLLSNLKPRLNGSNATTLLMVEQGLHEERLISTVEYLTDGTMLMKQDADGRFLMVSRMVLTPSERKWVRFSIRNGIEMRMASFFQ